jgi:hypothetical protein
MNRKFKGDPLYCNEDTNIQFESLGAVFSVTKYGINYTY